ncbi:MAG: aldehyde ferredoxin oxidoreductase N-terminal domain-containing protein, partial [Desulfovibrionaceae bacterium]|nr:aldehyde ferredoxin oxidoreductase N-terminal domain-containing protein [Desulfovibrionaceae bacterium]
MNGWTGSILLVDLDRGETGVLRPDRALYAKFLGGRGLAGHFLRPKATLAWDDPETPLLVFTGPLNGTASPTPGRATIMSRSPLTPATACSSVGGRLGRELKNAGWDGLIITGKSARAVGLEIRDREARLVDASMLAGLTTGRIFDRLTASEPKASLAATGPAAENGVLFASIAVDRHHAAGRSGLGLTMAAKGLKYLLILGTGRTEVHDPAMLKQARQDILRLTAASPVLMGGLG